MAIRPVRDIGGFGRLAQVVLQRRAQDQNDQDRELRRRALEGQLAASTAEAERAGQRRELGRTLADLYAGTLPSDGVGPPVPPEIIGQRGAQAIAQNPTGSVADLAGFLKVVDPTRDTAARPFQKGSGFLIRENGQPVLVTPRMNPTDGKVELVRTPVGGDVLSDLGETPEERQAREVATAGEKTGAVLAEELETKPAIAGATEREKLEAQQEIKPAIAKDVKLAEAAAGAATDAVQKIGSIRGNLKNYDNAIKAVRSGASTGTISRLFPSFRSASIELDNVQRRLGLDVIGSVTFGALSEGELKLALETALPTSLEGPELIQWIEDKRDAQVKMSNILQEAAIFLSQPGNTEADWLARNASVTAEAAKEAGAPVENPVTGVKFLGFEEEE